MSDNDAYAWEIFGWYADEMDHADPDDASYCLYVDRWRTGRLVLTGKNDQLEQIELPSREAIDELIARLALARDALFPAG